MTAPSSVITTSSAGPRSFLLSEHDVHRAWAPIWTRLEAAMRGGVYMTSRLRRFDWEEENGEAIRHRQDQATYINYPDLFASSILGYMMRQAPSPFGDSASLNFGSLGEVTPADTRAGAGESRADLIYYNCDGVGNDGSEWDAWWMAAGKHAMGLGHTWVMEEGPVTPPRNQDEELRRRPYLIDWGCLPVWDWHFEDGVLQYAILRVKRRIPRAVGGVFQAKLEEMYYLHTARGFDAFGEEYVGGGYWMYDADRQPISVNGVEVRGDYEWNDGAIPLHALYYERDRGTPDLPAISKPGIMELANLAESYMNLSSAADFEAWDSAKGMEYWMNVSKEAFELAMSKVTSGSRFIPIPASAIPNAPPVQVQDSNMGTVPAEVFDKRLAAKQTEASFHAAITQSALPGSSAESKEAGFAELKAPRISLFASELQSAQNTSIQNLERRFNGAPRSEGAVVWSRRFDLLDAMTAVEKAFETIALIPGAKSKTLSRVGVERVLREQNIVGDEKLVAQIGREVEESVGAAADSAQALRDRLGELGGGGGGGTGGDGAPPGSQDGGNGNA